MFLKITHYYDVFIKILINKINDMKIFSNSSLLVQYNEQWLYDLASHFPNRFAPRKFINF